MTAEDCLHFMPLFHATRLLSPPKALLSNLPDRAVLLSHTDLDLNPARYLRGKGWTRGIALLVTISQ